MRLFDLPGLAGYKTALAGWALLLIGVGKLAYTVGGILQGNTEIEALLPASQEFLAGLAVLGIGHKAERILRK